LTPELPLTTFSKQPPAKSLRQVPVAIFQVCQEERAQLLGPSLAHDAVASDGSLLGRRRVGGAIGEQFGRSERAEMV
jgi:hypothetical protein